MVERQKEKCKLSIVNNIHVAPVMTEGYPDTPSSVQAGTKWGREVPAKRVRDILFKLVEGAVEF